MTPGALDDAEFDGLSTADATTLTPPMELTLPRRSSRAETVAAAVEKHITSRKLTPGTHLGTRQQLGRMLAVAPSTVSEAIKLLEDRGRVVTRTGPGGGVFVSEPGFRLRLARSIMLVSGSEGEVADALEVRDLLESAVIVSAAGVQHAPGALEPMQQAVDALSGATDTADFFRRNLAFHSQVALLAGNTMLGTIYGGLLEVVRARDPQLELLPGQNRAQLHSNRIQIHRAIADAIVAGDVVAASAAAKAHAKQGHAVVSSIAR